MCLGPGPGRARPHGCTGRRVGQLSVCHSRKSPNRLSVLLPGSSVCLCLVSNGCSEVVMTIDLFLLIFRRILVRKINNSLGKLRVSRAERPLRPSLLLARPLLPALLRSAFLSARSPVNKARPAQWTGVGGLRAWPRGPPQMKRTAGPRHHLRAPGCSFFGYKKGRKV